jgi:hypothetical protein
LSLTSIRALLALNFQRGFGCAQAVKRAPWTL